MDVVGSCGSGRRAVVETLRLLEVRKVYQGFRGVVFSFGIGGMRKQWEDG